VPTAQKFFFFFFFFFLGGGGGGVVFKKTQNPKKKRPRERKQSTLCMAHHDSSQNCLQLLVTMESPFGLRACMALKMIFIEHRDHVRIQVAVQVINCILDWCSTQTPFGTNADASSSHLGYFYRLSFHPGSLQS